jgi:hypothetical protein
MKRFKLLTISLFLFCLCKAETTPAISYAGGSGSKSDPFRIATLAQLRLLSETQGDWGKHFILTADIDASDTKTWNVSGEDTLGFSPIGKDYNIYFSGSFNGNSHEINNLYINRSSTDHIGLFGYVTSAEISNMGLINTSVTGRNEVGVFCGTATNSTFQECFSSGKGISLNTNGGIIGKCSETTISNCFSNCTLKTGRTIGGIVGETSKAILSKCYSACSITATEVNLKERGGLVGSDWGSTIVEYSYWDKSTVGSYLDSQIGGVGLVTSDFAVEDNFTNWDFNDIWEIDTVKRIDSDNLRPYLRHILYDYEIKIEPNYSTGIDFFRGQSWYNEGDSVKLQAFYQDIYSFDGWYLNEILISAENPFSFVMPDSSQVYEVRFSLPDFNGGTGTKENPYQVSTLKQLGRISIDKPLWNKHFVLINNIDATDTRNWNISGEDTLGFSPIGNTSTKFTGSFDGQGYTINNLYINRSSETYIGLFGYISGATISNLVISGGSIKGKSYVGGLSAQSFHSKISNVFVSCDVSGAHIGGFVGDNSGTIIINGSSAGVVTGTGDVGGFIGFNSNSNVYNCYSTGAVNGSGYVGGIFGRNLSYSVVSGCYSTGILISNSDYANVFAGYNDPSNAISGNYFDNETSGFETSIYSEGLSTSEFSDTSNFTGFNFGTSSDSPWRDNANGRPYLYWQKAAVSNGVVSNGAINGYALAASGTSLIQTGIRYSKISNINWEYYHTGNAAGIIKENINISDNGDFYGQAYALDTDGNYYYGDMVGFTIYKVSASATPGGTILGDTVQFVLQGSGTEKIGAIADDGYNFIKWQNADGSLYSLNTPLTIENVDSNIVITAIFEPAKSYTVTASVTGAGGILSPLGDSTVSEGDAILYTITPNAGKQLITAKYNGISIINDLVNYGSYYTWELDSVNSNGILEIIFSDISDGINGLITSGMKISPNPSTGIVHISLAAGENNAALYIYDITGSLVYSQTRFNGGEADLSGLEKGMYLIRLKAGEKTLMTKLVKE